jgi:EAL domain-containing protein (putative c-di-GMP-specific phosphodiesterase class I)/CheY-like chemotaxis protein
VGLDVTVESREVVHTHREIEFPCSRVDGVVRTAHDPRPNHEGVIVVDAERPPPLPDDPVLIVDDDPAVRARLATALSAAGSSAIDAADGAEAVALVDRQPVSAAVVSNELPAMSGRDVARALRAGSENSDLPVLVVTDVDSVDELVADMAGGTDDYMTTPVAVDDLVMRVQAQQRRDPAWAEVIEPLQRRLSATQSLVGLPATAGMEDVAAAICSALINETGGPTAGLYMFASERRALLVAGRGLPDQDAPPGIKISEVESSYLFARARQGPWSGQAHDVPFDSSRRPARPPSPNDRGYIVAPIVRDDHPIGVLFVGGPPRVSALSLGRHHFATLLDFAATAGLLLGADFLHETEDETARDALRARWRDHQFCTSFQPVVELSSGRTVGYEALTRWDDGVPPDVPFADARRVGLASEIEIATLRSALTAAEQLPRDAWLSVNLSASTITGYDGLSEVLRDATNPIVIELTEHERISDYQALRARIAALGPNVRVAVDDAGAGYSTLGHILALEPELVKLDLSWIRGIDQDLPRQAMITGLAHFAMETGCELVAEGIETDQELEVVEELGVKFGQGFLLGPPEVVPNAQAAG